MTDPLQPPAPAKKKPLWTRWWFIAIVAVLIVGGIARLSNGGTAETTFATASPSAEALGVQEPQPAKPKPADTTPSVLDTTQTRAGELRGLLEKLQAEAPGIISEYQECVELTRTTPRPVDLPCHPYSGSDPVGYGLTNLVQYLALGETDAVTAASGECAAALSTSHSEAISGWAIQDAVKKLNDSFVVGYPSIDANLESMVNVLSSKAEAAGVVLSIC